VAERAAGEGEGAEGRGLDNRREDEADGCLCGSSWIDDVDSGSEEGSLAGTVEVGA
jgi:hypothetical protein